MKKVLSIALAVVMMLAVCVPAFAADITTGGGTGTTIIKTVTTTAGGEDAANFTVTIPADTEITWGAESTTLTYYVESHLRYGQHVEVSVAGNGVMSYVASADDTFTLPYALGGEAAYAAESPVVYPAASPDFTVNVAEDDWNRAVIGEYSDTLTFTAEVVTA